MKALRITCFICAVYYGLHTGVLFLNGYMTSFAEGVIPPEEVARNPMLRIQSLSGHVAIAFAPYLLIGLALCLLMGFLTRALWKAIPAMCVLLFAGGIAWAVAYYLQLQPYYAAVSNSIREVPGMGGMLGSYVKNSMNAGQYAGSYPVLVPGFVLFIFWRKARKEMTLHGPTSLHP